MIPWSCGGRRQFMRIRQSLIQLGTPQPGWRCHSAWELPWEPCGAEAGVMAPDGAATTPLILTTATTSSITAIEIATGQTAAAIGSGAATATGATIRNTAVEPPMETGAQPINLAVQLVGTHRAIARRVLVKT